MPMMDFSPENVYISNKNVESLLDAFKEVGIEVNAEKTKLKSDVRNV